MAARKSPVIDTASTLGRILGFLGISALCGVLAAGLLVPMAAATGVTASTSIEFFDELPAELEVGPLSQPSRVLAADGTQIARIYAENRVPVELDQVADVMEEAIIAIEDSRFYEHGGVDVQGIARAATNNILNGSRQGASTITQQYVNNVLNEAIMSSESDEELLLGANKDLGDKMREAKLAIAVEKRFTKEEILNGYLNIVFFNANAFGIEAAAQYFYGIPAADLNLQQSAMLAGMVRGPSLYDPTANPELAQQRRDLVLNAMRSQGKITEAEYDEAVASELNLDVSEVDNGCVTADMGEYFCDYVEHAFMAIGAPPEPTPEQREEQPEEAEQMQAARDAYADDRAQLLRRGGLTIETTLDPRLQEVAQAEVEDTAPPEANPDRIGASMVSVEPGTGKVLAMVQNTELVAPEDQWSNSYNFNTDATMGGTGGYQVGSTYKPYTLAAWLDSGRTLEDEVDAAQQLYERDFPWEASCFPDYAPGDLGLYDPDDPLFTDSFLLENFSEDYYRQMSVLDGIVNSINTATLASAAGVDLCAISDIANATGLHDGRTGQAIGHNIDTSRISSLIGGSNQSITPLAMSASFATFASNGQYCEPYAITSITDRSGEAMEVPAESCEQVLDKDVAEGVNHALQEVIERGSGFYIDPGVTAALKTGTTNDSVQTWTVGYTRGISTASWVGNPDENRSLNNLEFLGDGTTLDYVDGGTYAGQAWTDYMSQVADLYSTEEFPNPPEEMLEQETSQDIENDDGIEDFGPNDEDTVTFNRVGGGNGHNDDDSDDGNDDENESNATGEVTPAPAAPAAPQVNNPAPGDDDQDDDDEADPEPPADEVIEPEGPDEEIQPVDPGAEA